MLVDDDGSSDPATSAAPASVPADFRLGEAVTDLYSDARVTPLLRRLIHHSRELLGTVAGSVSLVDPVRGRYDKMAEIGIPCRLGQSFPLDEGATGRAVTSRMPVVIDDYSGLRHGHLPASHPASHGAVAAVPLWWRDQVIGVNVAFAGRSRTFSDSELDAFEELTQSVAPAVVRASRTVPSLAGLLREHGRVLAAGNGVATVVTEVGRVRPVPDGVASAAVDILAAVHHAAARRAASSLLRVAVVHRDGELRLLVQDEPGQPEHGSDDPLGLGTSTWHDLLSRAENRLDGEVDVEHVAGWGTLVRAAFPTTDLPEVPRQTAAEAPSSSLTGREREVLALLAQGMSDREVAVELGISPRTVEKHVGAAMRKTGTRTRTAAVVRAADLGWDRADGGNTPYRRGALLR